MALALLAKDGVDMSKLIGQAYTLLGDAKCCEYLYWHFLERPRGATA